MLLLGKRAIVSGASRGIGAAIAVALARQGASVCVQYRANREAAEDVARSVESCGVRSALHAGDVRDASTASGAVQCALDVLGGLDIMVCNAGIARDAVSWKMSDESWNDVLAVNLGGTFFFAREAARVFRQQRSGRIIMISSINGLRGKFGQANYSASKAGQIALCKSLAKELGRYDVTVNVVAPGMVLTHMSESLPEAAIEQARSEAVLARLSEVDDVAHAVVFLASSWARQITGSVIRVDGGQYI